MEGRGSNDSGGGAVRTGGGGAVRTVEGEGQ